MRRARQIRLKVAPHAGAWIETGHLAFCQQGKAGSHPTRVRGLKQSVGFDGIFERLVAPHAGAWIETVLLASSFLFVDVAPHAGAWIETVVHVPI